MVRLAVVGDFNPEFESHQATGQSVQLAAHSLGIQASVEWLATPDVSGERLGGYDAIWASPGSPYRSFDGMLAAIQYARERTKPFLGT